MKLDMIAFEAEMKRLRGAYIMDIAPACEMYRAALARAEAAEALAYERLENMLFAEQRATDADLRAEAAEAEAADAILVASDAAQREENAMHALSHFRARVAELEDALDSILLALGADPNDIDDYLMPQAAVGIIHALTERVAELEAALTAQQWQPVTDTKPEEAAEVELLVVGYRDGGIWYYHDDNPVRGWRPPTAPDAQEATTP